MLHAKFQDHRTSGSGEGFLKVFTINGHGGHLGQMTWTIYINFRSPFPRRLHIKFDFDWPSTLRSPCQPDGSGELKMVVICMKLAPG